MPNNFRNIFIAGGFTTAQVRSLGERLGPMGLTLCGFDLVDGNRVRPNLPRETDVVLVNKDAISHQGFYAYKDAAKAAGLPFVSGATSWSKTLAHLAAAGILSRNCLQSPKQNHVKTMEPETERELQMTEKPQTNNVRSKERIELRELAKLEVADLLKKGAEPELLTINRHLLANGFPRIYGATLAAIVRKELGTRNQSSVVPPIAADDVQALKMLAREVTRLIKDTDIQALSFTNQDGHVRVDAIRHVVKVESETW